MRREDLGDLAAFLAVAEERSFTRAAARLGTSQSALSHTIRRLEARLGLRLLTRTTRNVAPTEAGERLMETLRPALDEIDGKLAALDRLREKPAGTIRINSSRARRRNHPLAGAGPPAAGLPRHQGRGRHRPQPDRHRRRALRRRRAAGRAGRQGHDRRADRPGPAHGGGRRARLFRDPSGAQDAARAHRPQLHQPAPADARRALRLGVRGGRPRIQGAGRRPARVQRRPLHPGSRRRRASASPACPTTT